MNSKSTVQAAPKAMTTKRDDEQRGALLARARTALTWLASQCDGAVAADGQGFNATDAGLGHALAEKVIWSPREAAAAARLLVKYRDQLEGAGTDTTGLKVLAEELKEEVGTSVATMQWRDVIKGNVWVDEAAQRIVLKTEFHRQLNCEIKELVGSRWDGNQWTCSLTAENAIEVQELVQRWGLHFTKHAGWEALKPARKVELVDDRVLVRGVNAGKIWSSISNRCGDPSKDAAVFSGLQVVDASTIAIALRSWVISDALAWLEQLDEANQRRLGWAVPEVARLLSVSYASAIAQEATNYEDSSALASSQSDHDRLGSMLPLSVGVEVIPHQWPAIGALVKHQQAFLADEQGLGKTISVLLALEATKAFPAVVVVPAIALLNWRDEVERCLPDRQVSVLGSRVTKRDRRADIAQADILIVGYDSFESHIEALASRTPAALVLDEVQNLKAHDSNRTKAVMGFVRRTGVRRVIAVSGTPVMNAPKELLTILTLLPDFLAELGGFKFFAAKYCNATLHRGGWTEYWDFGGAGNLGELATRLRESGRFIRREKTFVLHDLPAKQRIDLRVEISNLDEYRSAAADLSAFLRAKAVRSAAHRDVSASDAGEIDVVRETMRSLGWDKALIDELHLHAFDRTEALKRTGVLRQLVGIGKVRAAVQAIWDIAEEEKVVVFAHHLEVQRGLAAGLKSLGMKVDVISGEMAPAARHRAIEKFQFDPQARVLVCSQRACQTAITLTAAKRVLFVELDWTPAALAQAEDRVHRIGQLKQVSMTYLLASGTLDDRMSEVLAAKREILEAVTRGGGAR